MLLLNYSLAFLLLVPLVKACSTVPTNKGTASPEPCVFPFKYQGVTYNKCIEVNDPEDKLWCSVEVDSNGNHVVGKERWGHCDLDLCNSERSTTSTTTTKTRPARPTTVNNRGETCSTISGNAPNRDCIFPFKFRGQSFSDCTLVSAGNGGKAWCSVQVDRQGNHQQGNWGDCKCIKGVVEPEPPFVPSPDKCQGILKTDSVASEVGQAGDFLPVQGQCSSDGNQFVINGDNATVNEFPFAALLAVKNKQGTFNFICGGSLINRRYVLTAAHCLDGPKIEHVVLGELDISSDCDCARGICSSGIQQIPISDTIIHEDWDTPKRQNDIGLLRLRRPAVLNPSVLPICLPLDPPVAADTLQLTDLIGGLDRHNLVVVGWGRTDPNDTGTLGTLGAASPILQKALLPVIDSKTCANILSEVFRTRMSSSTQVCAGKKDVDSCRGDSGGPLFFLGDDGVIFQIGIVSFGSKNCGDGHPGVYTRVSAFTSWIKSKLKR